MLINVSVNFFDNNENNESESSLNVCAVSVSPLQMIILIMMFSF